MRYQWVQHGNVCWTLTDGNEFCNLAEVYNNTDTPFYWWILGSIAWSGGADTLEEAKAAAEKALREVAKRILLEIGVSA